MNQVGENKNNGPRERKVRDNLQGRLKILGEEFSYRIHHDFQSMLFLGLQQSKEVNLDLVIYELTSLPGYREHRPLYYQDKVCHLYVMFISPATASAARAHFITQEGFHAEIVDQILRSWYAYEMVRHPNHKVAYDVYGVLDVVQVTRANHNIDYNELLSLERVTRILRNIGDIEILEFKKDCVRIAFCSMAEGIAACILRGPWYIRNIHKHYPSYYRIQLEKSDSFSQLLTAYNSSSTVDDAYGLEYFVTAQATALPQTSDVFDSGRSYLHNGTPRPPRQFTRGRGNRHSRFGRRSSQQPNSSAHFVPNVRNNDRLQYSARNISSNSS